jgi:CDP-glucose 4,6-dehydratase
MIDLNFFKNKKIFITGQTGFKGSWLAFILSLYGAKVVGYGLKPKNKFDNFYLLKLDKKIKNYYLDIRNKNKLKTALRKCNPDIIFHLAAQSLVKTSYKLPYYTFTTNILGTLSILEELRYLKNLKSAVIVTSDKCYKNQEKKNGYSESDEIGGEDPYSASKAASENIFYSYLNSFYSKTMKFGLASARAGNVIGGGDWSNDRIVPDFIKSIWKNKKFSLRSPNSTRPWQHVFDLLRGYLLLSIKIYSNKQFNGSWNFGPNKKNIKVIQIIQKLKQSMRSNKKIIIKSDKTMKETGLLSLKIKKSQSLLKWKSKLEVDEMIALTGEWYYNFLNNRKSILSLSKKQVNNFFND